MNLYFITFFVVQYIYVKYQTAAKSIKSGIAAVLRSNDCQKIYTLI